MASEDEKNHGVGNKICSYAWNKKVNRIIPMQYLAECCATVIMKPLTVTILAPDRS